MEKNNQELMTFGGHLEVLRRILFRILLVVCVLAIIIFSCKDSVWSFLLAPSESDFTTYRILEYMMKYIGIAFYFDDFQVELIATDLSSQFVTHITTSFYLALLGSSPYILYELFRFVSPALYESEKRHSIFIVSIIYLLFILGVLMNYYVIFPISFRFLGTYSVADRVHSTITLDSYIDTFTSLTLAMGLVFQLPIVVFLLSKMNFISYDILAKYRKHALLVIMFVAAIITPPDLMTLVLVTMPLYLLYEISVRVAKHIEHK